jgi:hypothetical protein
MAENDSSSSSGEGKEGENVIFKKKDVAKLV